MTSDNGGFGRFEERLVSNPNQRFLQTIRPFFDGDDEDESSGSSEQETIRRKYSYQPEEVAKVPVERTYSPGGLLTRNHSLSLTPQKSA